MLICRGIVECRLRGLFCHNYHICVNSFWQLVTCILWCNTMLAGFTSAAFPEPQAADQKCSWPMHLSQDYSGLDLASLLLLF